jgi:pseudouridine-5'-phosphate glycosidase
MSDDHVVYSQEVSRAMASGQAVVALESTVIAQGLPWPENLETAQSLTHAVRDAGAVPATIAVLAGLIRVGLGDAELGLLAEPAMDHNASPLMSAKDEGIRVRRQLSKANRRDLAAIVALGGSAATTVSATLWIARRFGLEPGVMATGGLGGVHRDASNTFDISTDLDELARAHGAVVVCSGLKSILDLPATLEVLETRGVLVVGFGTDELPGFLTRASGLPLEHCVETPGEAAAIIRAHRALKLPGAIILAQPVPLAASLDPDLLQSTLDQALAEASVRRIRGKDLTPFLLASIREATQGDSLRANQALLIANARLAAEIALALVDAI